MASAAPCGADCKIEMAPVADVPDEATVPGLNADRVLRVAAIAGLAERQAMASAFAAMPAKVLWRLSPSEVPDDAALAELGLGNNTKVLFSPVPVKCRQGMLLDTNALRDGCIQANECIPKPDLDSAIFQGYIAWFAMLWHVSVLFAVCSNCSATLSTVANLLA